MIDRPKPPLAAVVVELLEGHERRRTRVIYDGETSWFFDDGVSREMVVPGSAVRILGGRIEHGDVPIGDHAWIVDLIEGRETVCGRPCWDVECSGLRQNEPETRFRLSIDEASGIILRSRRPDIRAAVEFLELAVL
jgi:hypothetical protein